MAIAVNIFTAGMAFKESEHEGKLYRCAFTVIMLVIGSVVYLFDVIRDFIIYINKVFRIVFFLEFWFTKKWKNVDKKILRVQNWKLNVILNYDDYKEIRYKLSTRIWMYQVGMINRRHGYDFSKESHCPHCGNGLNIHELEKFQECYKCGKPLQDIECKTPGEQPIKCEQVNGCFGCDSYSGKGD